MLQSADSRVPAPAADDVGSWATSALADGQVWSGLTTAEADAARVVHGANALSVGLAGSWVRDLVAQFVHPLAILLWGAAGLALFTDELTLSIAIVIVLMINAAFAFTQERQAEHAVDAINDALPPQAQVVRDGRVVQLPATEIVPGDLVVVGEGDQSPADGRIVAGSASVDASMLTGESVAVERFPVASPRPGPLLQAQQVILRGTAVVAGEVQAVVFATGPHTQIGVVAALTASVRPEPSPLEIQVKRVAWVISVIAVAVGAVFLPVGLAAGLSWNAAVVFAIGLLIANVPEGLLPTITLALAGGVRRLARHGAVVKRLSSVETLGSTSTICTDKTGTLTQNTMTVREVWTPPGGDPALPLAVMQRCHSARLEDGAIQGDPTETALLEHARSALDVDVLPDAMEPVLVRHRFDASLRRMSVVVPASSGVTVLVKGAAEVVLDLCTSESSGADLGIDERTALEQEVERLERAGYRVLVLADRRLAVAGAHREDDERDLRVVGLVGLMDPPRPDAAEAIRRCHEAGIRVHVITGDSRLTAEAVAREVGLSPAAVVDGEELAAVSDAALADLVARGEIVFARASPSDKLRIAAAVRSTGEIFAMTGDGVNDAPALRYADIGIAMGRGGTDVAREAASMVLTDDDFASIVRAIESGRQVYANIRKFIVYVFAHAIPEAVPFLIFALSGGSIPLGITGMQILAVDLGTETLPALALGRERSEPGAMQQPPRSPSEHIITPGLLLRSWGLLGLLSAVLTSSAFLIHLRQGGWSPGMDTGPGSALHTTYLEATSITFVGIVLCQVGTAFAARTTHASLFDIGVFTNRGLLWGIAFELAVAGAVVYVPSLQGVFGTSALSIGDIAPLLAFPVVVWGADELVRWRRRRAGGHARPQNRASMNTTPPLSEESP